MAVRTEIEYAGDLHCAAVHGPSGHRIETDAPADNQGKGELFSPTDLVGAALGACILTILGIAAKNRGIDITGARATVDKEMSAVPRRHISRLAVRITLPAHLDERRRRLFEDLAGTCPVAASLGPDTKVELRFEYA